MAQLGRLAGIALAALAMIVVGLWSTTAEAHGVHVARAGHHVSQPVPVANEAAAVRPLRDHRADADCLLDCCPGGATCVAHVAGPPVSAPVLPDPGSIRLQPSPGRELPGIIGERLPRPPRAP